MSYKGTMYKEEVFDEIWDRICDVERGEVFTAEEMAAKLGATEYEHEYVVRAIADICEAVVAEGLATGYPVVFKSGFGFTFSKN